MSNKLLLVGIDHYLHHPILNNCVKDLKDFRDILLEKFDFEDSDVVELFNGEATSKHIQDAFVKFGQTLGLDDNLIVFFSGHGYYDANHDRGFWVPAEGTRHYSTWIPNETLIALLERINCRHIFLISDTCFSNQLLNPNPLKSINEYTSRKSRWALTSAFNESYDSAKNTNSQFAAAILDYLSKTDRDFRVGELIESVKVSFSANRLQTPQGSPLYCKGHSSGEFVFVLKQALDSRRFRGYNDFLKVLGLYRRTSQLKEIKTWEDTQKRIGFQLYEEFDSVFKKLTYYLYLYQGSSHNQTYKYLQEHFQYIFKENNLLIFIAKEKESEIPDVLPRIEVIAKKFKPVNSFYIDDFIRVQCTPKIEFDNSSVYLNISNFILPSLASGLQGSHVDDFIKGWFAKQEKPILVVAGTGGIGKTTFAQYVSDAWIKKSPKSCVMFIDSIQIKDLLLKRNIHSDSLSIYDFYEAFWEICGMQSAKLTEEQFRINIDAGNILVVIDGLDEIISKVPKFSVDEFLKSISESTSDIAGGKVIVTCRTSFWDNSERGGIDISVIELEPFNIDQARQFFEKSLDSNGKVKKALRLAEQFRYPGIESNNYFHPYVLDVVRSIVVLGQDGIEADLSNFSSKFLRGSVKNDYIIYRICDRERKRVGQISVDDQIKVLMYLAIEKRGTIKIANFRDVIEEALNKKVDGTNVLAFKSHPFLRISEPSLEFRYDFFEDLFKSIYVASFIDIDKPSVELPPEFVLILEENCWFGSGINADVVHRFLEWNELHLLLFNDFVGKICNHNLIAEAKRLKTIGNLFSLALELNQKFAGNTVSANTVVLTTLFGNQKGDIRNLSLNNIASEFNLRFDFSGLRFHNCYFNGYGSFWDCKVDAETRFIECHLLNLKSTSEKQALNKVNFQDCIFDQDLEDTLRRGEETAANKFEQTKSFLNHFFHLFFSGGKLGRQWEHKIVQPRFRGISQNRFNYGETIDLLRSHKVLVVTKELSKNKFAISDDFKEDVIRFTKDGTLSRSILLLINELNRS